MSYAKMIKWNKKHPKGTKQPVIMYASTERTFTPSVAYMNKYFIYREKCEKDGIEPKDCEEYYYARN